MSTMTPEDQRSAMERLHEAFGQREELHPDLAAYRVELPRLGTCIKHPLYFSMLHNDAFNAIANEVYAAKQEIVAEAIAKGDYRQAVWHHERAYRLTAFLQYAHEFTDHQYWTTLGDVYTDSENVWQQRDEWHAALSSDRPRRWAMMDKPERDAVRALKRRRTPVLVYRGWCHARGGEGLSWSLSRSTAEWFARRFAQMGHAQGARLAAAVCDAKDIVAYFASRGEQEIVIMPEHVHVTKVLTL